MSINTNIPLLSELRQGLWHCTSPISFRQILADGSIKPATVSRFGTKPNACQELGAVSLFDFQTPTKEQVEKTLDRWGPFVLEHRTTVVIGLNRTLLQNNLVPYPKNKVKTTGAVIPHVETCHCGNIPITAITKCLLVCSVDCSRFYIEHALADARLDEVEREFQNTSSPEAEEMSRMRQDISDKAKTSEVQAQLEKARRATR